MTDGTFVHWFPFAFPLVFVGLWLLVSAILGFMSGWLNLQQWYPDDGSEEPLLTLGWQSGVMGSGVALNNCLRLSAKRSGLSVAMWRIFAPFQRPLLIPWTEITAEPTRSFFTPMVKLSFGNPANGRLKISGRSWSKLVGAVPQAGAGMQLHLPDVPEVSAASVARGLFLEWLILGTILTVFFALLTRSTPEAARSPLGLIALPVCVLAIAQIIRFMRQA